MKTAIVLGLILLCIGMVYLYPHSMLEPGELVQAHQRTGDDCFSCHSPFAGLPNDKCIACHPLADIGNDEPSEVPPMLFHEALAALECVACHTDHKGRNADLTPGVFSHALMPVPTLNDCNRCHVKPTDALHRELPVNCVACHDPDGWKSAHAFDHSLLTTASMANCATCHKRPEDGLHERMQANCSVCHKTTSWEEATFDHVLLSAAEKGRCTTCHQPPKDAFHQGNKANCATCHGTEAWSPATFDHTRYFRLDGDHNAKCVTCHVGNNYSTYTCYGCHEHTPGNILQEHREEGITMINDCARCHRSGDEDDARRGSGEGEGSHNGHKRDGDD